MQFGALNVRVRLRRLPWIGRYAFALDQPRVLEDLRLPFRPPLAYGADFRGWADWLGMGDLEEERRRGGGGGSEEGSREETTGGGSGDAAT